MQETADRAPNLHDGRGERKYLNQAERRRVIAAFGRFERKKALFALTLAWTGARVSEVLELRVHSFQVEECRVAIRTLKRRRLVVREVPVPGELMESLDRQCGCVRHRGAGIRGALLADGATARLAPSGMDVRIAGGLVEDGAADGEHAPARSVRAKGFGAATAPAAFRGRSTAPALQPLCVLV